jgi:hypothetical protein
MTATYAEAPDDATIVAYHCIFAATDFHEIVKTAGCRHSSSQLISDTLARHSARLGAEDRSTLRCAAYGAANCPAEEITTALERFFARGIDRDPLATIAAAQHPHAGADIERWYRLDNGTLAPALLSSPGVDAEFLARHWGEAPRSAVGNPASPRSVLDDALAAQLVEWVDVVGHPLADPQLIAAGAQHDDPKVRRRAISNPTHGTVDLLALRAGEQRRPFGGDADVLAHIDRLLDNHSPADPLDATVAHVLFCELRCDLAAIVATLSPDTVTVAGRLVRGGFSGTVAELLDLADDLTP